MGSKFSQEIFYDRRDIRGIMWKNIHFKAFINMKKFHIMFLYSTAFFCFYFLLTLADVLNAILINSTALTENSYVSFIDVIFRSV